MHVDTGDIYHKDKERNKWVRDQFDRLQKAEGHPEELPEELTDEEMEELKKQGRMVMGTVEDLHRRRKMAELFAGTPNQRKKYRQLKKKGK